MYKVRRGRINGYFYWFYNEGLNEAWQKIKTRIFWLYDFFSIRTLLKTLFAPWKNDTQSAKNIALSDQVQLWGQNLASRLFGFFLRTTVVGVALITIGIFSVVGATLLLIWLLAPVLIIILPILAFLVL